MESFDETVQEVRQLQGKLNKRARTRLRSRRSAKTSAKCDDVIDLHGHQGPVVWMNIQDGMWPTILTQSDDREDLKEKISDFIKEEIGRSIASYEHFHRLPRGSGTIEMLATSSAGIAGWLELYSTLPIDIGGGRVASGALCGLWARQALSHVQESEWELIVFTVDSGASETVVPPSVGRGLPLVDSDKVGLEHEVANGGVVVNLGENMLKYGLLRVPRVHS